MKKIFGLLVVGAIASLASMAQARELRVGTECTYPPFTFKDANGALQGFDIDIAREVGKRIGADVNFVCQPFDSMIPGLMAGKFDVVAASLSITEERKKSIDFSLPYRSVPAHFVAAKGTSLAPLTADGKPNPAGIKGKTIGIQRSTTYEKFMREKFPGADLTLYDTVDNMLLDLTAKRIDLAFAGTIKLANDFLDKPRGKDFSFVGPEINDVQFFGIGIAMGLRKGEDKLRAEVDAALKGMFSDGTFKTINAKYWSFSVLPTVSP